MNHVSQFQRLYGWTPSFRTVFKKPAPQEPNFKVPQTNGRPGWLIFTYQNSIPVCIWVNAQECTVIPCIVDERICGDTFLRVERLGSVFVVADIWMLNSNCIFARSTFQQRYDWLKKFISIHSQIKLIHKSDVKTGIRGYEIYTSEIGSYGHFVEDQQSIKMKIKKLQLPDCYQVGSGYLRVPDMKTSVYLRSLGNEFELMCTDNQDGSWSLSSFH